jgi:hypothetical protein
MKKGNNEMEIMPTGQLNEVEIAALKKKHGAVTALKSSDGLHIAYLKSPDRKTVSYAMAQMNGGQNPMAFAECLLEECWIAGSEVFKEEDAYFLGAIPVLQQLVEMKTSELVKL